MRKLLSAFRRSPELTAVPSEELAVRGSELVQSPNRVVVFGSHVSGAEDLARQARKGLDAFNAQQRANGLPEVSVESWRDAGHLYDFFYGRTPDNPTAEPTIPRGVIAFPEMRQYDPYNGRGMFIPTPVAALQELCDQYGVPLILAERNDQPEPAAIEAGLGAIAAAQTRPAIEQ